MRYIILHAFMFIASSMRLCVSNYRLLRLDCAEKSKNKIKKSSN